MILSHPATVLIAEDEPLLAAALGIELTRIWPALRIVDTCTDGDTALATSLQHHPDLLFLDIHMPGLNGLEVARELVDAWPEDRPAPLIVFATAFDDHAVEAFEQAAVDYLLKPVQPERLLRSCERLHERLLQRLSSPAPLVGTETGGGEVPPPDALGGAAATAAPPGAVRAPPFERLVST